MAMDPAHNAVVCSIITVIFVQAGFALPHNLGHTLQNTTRRWHYWRDETGKLKSNAIDGEDPKKSPLSLQKLL